MNRLWKVLRRGAAGACVATIGLVAWSSPATATIHFNLESPSPAFPASGVGNVSGWVFTDTPGAKMQRLVTVQIDADAPYRVPCCSSRGDVKAAFPAAPENSGFSGAYNFQRLSPGQHTIKLTFKSTTGETKVVTKSFEVVKVSPFNFLQSFEWKPGAACESLNGLDPAHGNAGAVCDEMRSTANASPHPTSDCSGTVQFAFNRASQTFQPVAGCDPQGTVNTGGGIEPGLLGKLPPGFTDILDPGVQIGKLPPGFLTCPVGTPANLSVDVDGLVPTFTFTTAVAAKVGVEIYEKGQVGQTLAAFGNGDKATFHQIKPHPLMTTIAPDTEYEYRLRVKSNCGKADLVVSGPSTFKTKKRVARAFIDKAYVIDDGDDWPAGAGEISFHIQMGGKTAQTGDYSADDGDTLYPSVALSWNAATDYFDVKVSANEDDGGFESWKPKILSFGPSLTYSGGTWTGTRNLHDDNMHVKAWIRVEVAYE